MAEKNKNNNSNNLNDPNDIKEPKLQRGPFKKKRAGIVLTKDEVKQIKEGRKKLRKDMRAMGIKSKKEFELTASSMLLYFDKHKRGALFWWHLLGKGGVALLLAGSLLLAALYGVSWISEYRGHFTISLSDDLFREGFTISETVGFENPTSHLFATPAEGVPCISVIDIPNDVDDIDGAHNGNYFAYTFYVRNEGESAASYSWQMCLNSESLNLSEAAWIMVFEDGKMEFYAKPDENGAIEALPAMGDNTRGYIVPPLYDKAKDPEAQYETIAVSDAITYWRLKPKPFLSDTVMAEGIMSNVQPMEFHKYTVVIWLEGDDPDCTNDLIGGNLGLDFRISLIEEGTSS